MRLVEIAAGFFGAWMFTAFAIAPSFIVERVTARLGDSVPPPRWVPQREMERGQTIHEPDVVSLDEEPPLEARGVMAE
jgi:hypothetical protein